MRTKLRICLRKTYLVFYTIFFPYFIESFAALVEEKIPDV